MAWRRPPASVWSSYKSASKNASEHARARPGIGTHRRADHPDRAAPQQRLGLLLGQGEATLEEDERRRRRLVPVGHLELADQGAMVPLPQEDVCFAAGLTALGSSLTTSLIEFRGDLVAGVGELLGGVAPRTSPDSGRLPPGLLAITARRRAVHTWARRRGRAYASGDTTERSSWKRRPTAKENRSVALRCERLQVDERVVIAADRVRPRLPSGSPAGWRRGGPSRPGGSGLVLQGGADRGLDVVAGRIGQQRRGASCLQRQPRRPGRTCRPSCLQVLRVGDDQGRGRATQPRWLVPTGVRDRLRSVA